VPGAPLELIAVEVRADLDQLQAQMPGAARVVDQSMGQVQRSVVAAERQVVRSSAAISQGFNNAAMRSRLLGYQISDIGTQLASGQSPFLVLAQQGPQVANALEGVGGVAGRLAAFFSGPWGAALLAATTIAGGLIAKLWESEDAADSAAEAANRLASAWANIANLKFDSNDLTSAVKDVVDLERRAAELERRARESGADRGAGGRYYQQQAEALRQEIAQKRRELADATNPRNPARVISERNQAIFEARPERERRTRRPGKSDAEREAERLAKQAERERLQMEEQYAALLRRLDLERRLLDIRAAGTPEAEKQADILEATARIAEQFPELDAKRLRYAQDIAAAQISAAHAMQQQADRAEKLADDLERIANANNEKIEEQFDRLADQQEQRIRTLGQLYYDAFSGGTRAIWDDFKQIGLAVIAEVLARFTLAQMGGGGFNFGDALGAAIGSVLPGFASGGSMVLGGRGGTDRNVLAYNGRPIARVSAGEVLNISNPALSRGGSQPIEVTVKVEANDYFDARVASVSRQVATPIAQQTAAQIGGAVAQGVLKAMPRRMAQFSRDGT
jgi:phage host-nuclease inhibitor protein Gam